MNMREECIIGLAPNYFMIITNCIKTAISKPTVSYNRTPGFYTFLDETAKAVSGCIFQNADADSANNIFSRSNVGFIDFNKPGKTIPSRSYHCPKPQHKRLMGILKYSP